MSQQHTKYHPNEVRILRDNWCINPFSLTELGPRMKGPVIETGLKLLSSVVCIIEPSCNAMGWEEYDWWSKLAIGEEGEVELCLLLFNLTWRRQCGLTPMAGVWLGGGGGGCIYCCPTLHEADMGLGKSEKGGKWCGGLGAAVGPQWDPGAKPLVGVWGQRPQKLKVFSVCHHKKQHSGAWKSDICKSASLMFRPDIYLAILKIALKMSFWW